MPDYEFSGLVPDLKYDDAKPVGNRAFVERHKTGIREATLGPLSEPAASGMGGIKPPVQKTAQAKKAVRKLTPEELEALYKKFQEEMMAQHAAMLAAPSAVQPTLDKSGL